MNAILRFFTLRADDVCAYLWARADPPTRQAWCAAAAVSDAPSLLGWHELGAHERLPLVGAMVDEIQTTVAHLRMDHHHEEASHETA